ncbi:preprotein translocase subunit YajC [Thermodesulfobacteriota bacterium]
MINIAYAMGQGGLPGGQGAQGGLFGSPLFPLILMFVIFYFLLIRPQQKRQKEHREMLNNLKKGDSIITGGGIHGRITGVKGDTILVVEIADKVRVKVNRNNVAGLVQPASNPPPSKADKSDSKK